MMIRFGENFTFTANVVLRLFWLLIGTALVCGVFRSLFDELVSPYLDTESKFSSMAAAGTSAPFSDADVWRASPSSQPRQQDPLGRALDTAGAPSYAPVSAKHPSPSTTAGVRPLLHRRHRPDAGLLQRRVGV